jgi:TfoX/Sxy family transcriptional regulator of competence genes
MTDVYKDVKEYFAAIDSVVVNSGKGAQGIKFKGKMFCMFFKGDLMVKLDPDRVNELVESGEGEAYPHSKDRVVISVENKDQWIDYVQESLDYVSG